MATRKIFTLILGIIIAAVIVVQSTVGIYRLNRTDSAILPPKAGYFSSL